MLDLTTPHHLLEERDYNVTLMDQNVTIIVTTSAVGYKEAVENAFEDISPLEGFHVEEVEVLD